MLRIILSCLLIFSAVASLQLGAITLDEGQVSVAGLQSLDDEQLSYVTGQYLMYSDYIGPNSLPGAVAHTANGNCNSSGVGSGCGTGASVTDFSFYRMGLNGKLGLNMNIAKLQLGCGGINDALNNGVACDIDLDYVSLMGLQTVSGTTRPAGYGDFTAGSTAGAESQFQLTRPYMEIAVKNDQSTTLREVVGIKIGAAHALGAMSIGRVYQNGQTNQENRYFGQNPGGSALGDGPNNASCNPNASFGNAQLACHSGVNAFSGFMGAELSASIRIRANTNVVFNIELLGNACVGRLTNPNGARGTGNGGGCGYGATHADNAPVYLDAAGTRMNALHLSHADVNFNGSGLASIISTMDIQLYADLRALHMAVVDSSDFFLSFQREQIAWPGYTKQPLCLQFFPGDTSCGSGNSLESNNPQWDLCGRSGRPDRCNSAYAYTANTGWWMNLPNVKLRDLITPGTTDMGNVAIGTLTTALGQPGLRANNVNLGLLPAKNCFGSAAFC